MSSVATSKAVYFTFTHPDWTEDSLFTPACFTAALKSNSQMVCQLYLKVLLVMRMKTEKIITCGLTRNWRLASMETELWTLIWPVKAKSVLCQTQELQCLTLWVLHDLRIARVCVPMFPLGLQPCTVMGFWLCNHANLSYHRWSGRSQMWSLKTDSTSTLIRPSFSTGWVESYTIYVCGSSWKPKRRRTLLNVL